MPKAQGQETQIRLACFNMHLVIAMFVACAATQAKLAVLLHDALDGSHVD